MDETNVALTLMARRVLAMSQRELANLLGISERTVQRWDSGRSTPYAPDMARLAVAVHPRNAALAQRIAARSGKSLEELGVRTAQADAAEPAARVPPEMVVHLASTVVCATADVLGVPPATARTALLVALRKAADLELSAEDLAWALDVSSSAKDAKGRAKQPGRPR